MIRYIKTIFLTLTAATLSSGLSAAEYTFTVYNFHPGDARVCESKAEEIASYLESNHGVETVATMCENSQWTKTVSLNIKYKAAEPIAMVSNYSLRGYEKRGFYKSEASCNRYLADEARRFEKRIGLKPFLKFCTFNRLDRDFPWFAQLHAVGSSDKQFLLTSWRTGKLHGESQMDIMNEVNQNLWNQGYTLNNFAWRSGMGMGRGLTVGVFTDRNLERLNLDAKMAVEIPGLQNCLAARDKLKEDLKKKPELLGYLTAYCDSHYSNPTRFNLRFAYIPKTWIDVEYSNESFNSLSECQQKRQASKSKFESFYGNSLVASVCGYRSFLGDRKYRIGLILAPRM
jgi:hypothetical protein